MHGTLTHIASIQHSRKGAVFLTYQHIKEG